MRQTSARLLLLLSLLQAQRAWSGPALAERLGISARTVRRDIDRLRELGYPVSVTKGPGATYRLSAGSALPPLLFDDDQVIAVSLALQLAPKAVVGFGEAAARALATIRQVMPPRLRSQIDAMRITAIANAWEFPGPSVETTPLIAVGAAVREREVLRFDYASTTAQETDWTPPLRVEPHRLLVWSGRWYLVAWDLDRAEWRVFRVDRIVPRMPTGLRFRPRELPGPDVVAYVKTHLDRGDTVEDWPCQGVAILDVPAAAIAEWVPGGAVVEEIGPERCRLSMGAWSWIGLAALYGTFAADMEVIGPPELVEACAELAARYSAVGAARP
ncbi:WYL domain-containing protein [Nonomuraea sp. NBC_01738]|uniref:helix-turn-helix transcriptional regulator n=1 Tax=Nonomuraea sp. NBC_01738 TaxID=2976003 RepID=UPI002E100FC0|nr:WYL domain-containing protein [Nonomuraea sp. NBC_01738]